VLLCESLPLGDRSDFVPILWAFLRGGRGDRGRNPKQSFMLQTSGETKRAACGCCRLQPKEASAILRNCFTPICRFEHYVEGTWMAPGRFKTKSGVGHPMTRGEPKRQDDSGCKILQFRSRHDADGHHKHAADHPGRDIDQLLDLSRYEKPPRYTEDYKARMVENMAAVLLLSALVAVAAFDFIDLEQIQHCASATGCWPEGGCCATLLNVARDRPASRSP
jgi:hypothetical protein